MNILHVINRYGWSGGAESQLSKNLAFFNDANLSHTVVALYDQHEPLSVRSHSEGDVEYLFDEEDRPSRAEIHRALYRRVREIQPDLIHCTLADSALASRIVGFTTGIPVLESLVNISHEEVRAVDSQAVTSWKLRAHGLIDRTTMKAVKRFHALTHAVADSWSRQTGIPPQRITVIPRGVDLSEFDLNRRRQFRSEVRNELEVNADTRILLNTARQEPQKGQRYLLEAMPAVLREFPDCVLVMAGRTGQTSSALDDITRQLGLDSNVMQVGVRADIPRLLLAADVFVFPSLFEGLGVSLLEAMASAAPSVVTDAPALKEVVEPNEAALVVPIRDSKALSEAVIRILSDQDLAEELGRRGRRSVEDRFRIEDTSAQMETLYRELGGLD